MLYIAFALAAASGLFYQAGDRGGFHWLRPLCTYDDTFCQHPHWLLYAALLAFAWGLFLRVDRI